MSTYTPVVWSKGDPMDLTKLNQMSANDQYLFNKIVYGKHSFDGAEQTEGLKIWASNERFPITESKRAEVDVSWEGFFSPSCNPIVNVTVGRRTHNRLWISVKGPGNQTWPNSRGCQVHAVLDPEAPYDLTIHMPIHIIAIGW